MQGLDDDGLRELVVRAQAGDAVATASLVEGLLPSVRARVHRRLQRVYRPHNAWATSLFSTGDIVQELMLQALRDLARFRGETADQLAGWLSGQIENRILEQLRYWRAAKRDQRRRSGTVDDGSDLVDGGASPLSQAAVAEAWQAFRDLLAELPADDRAILERGLDVDASWQAIATELGLPTAEAARQRHKRARARLSLRMARRHPELFRFTE